MSFSTMDAAMVELYEKDFEAALERVPCFTPFDARRLVHFSSRCVLTTPISGVTPYSLLTAWLGLRVCLSLVDDWANPAEGRDISEDDLICAWDLSWDLARKAAGKFCPELSGPPAACWAVFHLVDAAVKAATMAGEDGGLDNVAQGAILAIRLARRAGVERTQAALDHQMALFLSIFHRPLELPLPTSS